MVLGLIHFGIMRKIHKQLIQSVIFGLAGLGTNTFSAKKQRDDYEIALMTTFQKILRRSVEENMQEINSIELNLAGKNIDQCISEWMRAYESGGDINDINLHRIIEMINKKYTNTPDGMAKVLTIGFNKVNFLNELQKIEQLANFLNKSKIAEIKPLVKDLVTTINTYNSYKTAIINQI